MQRRNFLYTSTAAAAFSFLDAHLLLPLAACNAQPGHLPPRITALRLLTAAPLASMKTFYCDLIGFERIAESPTELSIRTGQTLLTFVKTDAPVQQPFYHFAFNIPENKILAAYEWQKAKTPLVMPRPGAMNEWRTKGHPKEIYNFQHWNAHAIFFLDPAANLVEYIARHELANAAPEAGFSAKDLLYASEIGFVVDAPNQEASHFQQHLNLLPYLGNSATFQPMGDAHGLLLLLQRGTLWTDHSENGHATDVFTTSITIHSQEKKVWSLPGYPYQVTVE